jgi:membrane protein implicated in regulation of membrane protease activity
MTWITWLTISAIFIICEILSPFVCSLCLAIGSFFAAVVTYIFDSYWIEIMTFSIVSILSLCFVKPLFKEVLKKSKTVKSNVDALIGIKAVVIDKIMPFKPGFVKVLGEIWRAKSDIEILEGQMVKIMSIDGTTLIVEK